MSLEQTNSFLLIFIQEFLSLEEFETKKGILANGKEHLNNSNGLDPKLEKEKLAEKRTKPTAIVLSGVSASWQPDGIVNTLRNVNLTVQPGEFIGVAGLVGSGKVRP